jgi:hypothetical protein
VLYLQEWGSRFQEEMVDEYLAEGTAQLERLKVGDMRESDH